MWVDLAVQVCGLGSEQQIWSYYKLFLQTLSETVSNALRLTGGEEATETAEFIAMMEKFIDSKNVHNFTHGYHSLKSLQAPYTSGDDFRLKV